VEQRNDNGRHTCRLSENARNLNRRNTYEVLGSHRLPANDCSPFDRRTRRHQSCGCRGLLIGLWAILGTWQDEAAARAVPRPVAPRGPLRPSEQATIDLVEKTRVSVVNITTQANVVDRWTRNVVNIARGTGSEFTWNDRGHLVTNYDVVAYGSGAQVRLSDEHDAQSSLVGVSTLVDL
jgi:S1-C subfamily serine protease